MDKPSKTLNATTVRGIAMKNNTMHAKRKGLSSLLATVILIAVTVVAGGAVYGIYTQGAGVAGNVNIITVGDINMVATQDHGSFSMTIKNGGNNAWKSVAINAFKGQLPAAIFYRPITWSASGTSHGGIDPVFPSNIVDLKPGDNNGGLIGIGNLISYSTTNPVFWGPAPFGLTLRPSALCANVPNDMAAVSFIDTDGNCTNGIQSYVGKKIEPIQPGGTISPAAFVLTKPILDSSGNPLFEHDTVTKGDTIVISIIVETVDGSKTQKEVPVKVL
ncbi:MAG: archaellin/type IV pilin N-terminal domain-containing protein [Nitrososphaerales archaeon]